MNSFDLNNYDVARRIAGELIMIRMPGTVLDAQTAQFLRDNHIRAVCLFRQNMVDAAQLTALTSDLREVLGPNALIALDQEGGAVVRAHWLPHAPSAMALGAADDADLARAVGAAVARGVRSLGFNWNFAPVLDLNNNVDNPVIAERSFGSDPRRAGTLANAWMKGSLSENVACCIKHFPGHGDTHVDSHRDLPTVAKPLADLHELELAPFRQAAQLAPALMTAHIVYPAFDSEFPATMSHRILTGLLRGEMGYRGVVITDGMDMQAIVGGYGAGNAAVTALTAGADMVMALGARATQEATLSEMADAIQAGQFDPAALLDRLNRLDRLAQAYPCASETYLSAQEDAALMAQAWQRGLTALDDPAPPPPGSKVRLVACDDTASDGVAEAGLPAGAVSALLARFYDVQTVLFSDPETFDWDAMPADGRIVILASTMRLRYPGRACRSWRPDLHLVLWNPFAALDVAAPALVTYGFAQPALDAVAAWLAGTLQPGGKSPVAGFGDHMNNQGAHPAWHK